MTTLQVFQPNLFKGKVVFTTGGGSGICKGMTEALMRHGADAVICGRTFDKLKASAEELSSKTGQKCIPVAADVRKFEDLAKAFEVAKSTFGRVDIVIAGAAGNFLSSAERISPNGFKTVVDIDLIGTFNTAKAALPYLKESKGLLLSVSATFHYVGSPLQVHAAAAKAGVDAITRTLAVEWGAYGIRVNTIAPGPIAGTLGMEKLSSGGKFEDAITANVPLKRYGTIMDIEYATLYLASAAASYVTGAVLVVDGGSWLARGGVGQDESQWRGKL
ncbi:hypothetical protein BJ742DRAFT_673249 [Cladochytrium replicatum]|nr:hypothetical protein BJ742DRAFT_673249 [Cladochytrium replicatum]